jgi:WD40 repeat protein
MGGVLSVAYSPDGKYIASGGEDSVVNLIDTEKMEICHVFDDFKSISNIIIYLPFYYIMNRRKSIPSKS